MEDIDYITISDDEVEVLDHFIRCEPIIVDLTHGSPPKPPAPQSKPSAPQPEPSAPQPKPPAPQPKPPASQPEPPAPQPKQPEPQPRQPAPQQKPSAPQPKPPAPQPEPSAPQQKPSAPQQKPSAPQQKPSAPQPEPPAPQPKPPEPKKPAPNDRELMIAKKEQGNKKFRCNAFDDAIRCYREAMELSRKVKDEEMAAVLHFNLAMSYDKLGSYTQAADECAAAVKIDDQYIKAHVKRAEIYMACGKYEEAVICYEHICEVDSTVRNDALQRIAKAKALSEKMRKPDQYEILGLRPHFTPEQLKTAYKQKARAHHPDRHSDADVVTRRIHERIFKEASEANSYFRKRFNYN